MSDRFDDLMALWTLPLTGMRLLQQVGETVTGARQVVQTRLPKIVEATRDPLGADTAELALMVSEKVAAFGQSAEVTRAAGARVRAAAMANARAVGRMAAGGIVWPDEWLRIADENLAASVSLASLPLAALTPIHRTVRKNERRLRRPKR